MLVKVKAPNGRRATVTQEAEVFKADVLHVGADTVTLELAAQNIAYDKSSLEAPAGQPFDIKFTNNDAGVPHNVSIHQGSATGPEVFRGEIFVTSMEGGITKRITDTPWQERSVSFSPDGRTLVYAAEKDNNWNVYIAAIVRKEEPYFYASTVLKEEPVIATAASEANILRLRFGLVNGRAYTLKEVGQKFGLTRERIRQIESQALRRLRHPCRSRQLRDYLS